MAKLSLRDYINEIEDLIERGQNQEAIANCRYLLKLFPKHIDTYRLMGKAFMELRRYTEASDVLHRVLSAIPDDFVSHLGMSIIREDEGNLDAAIWHMERAFEVQPSNPAIQDELRRLYGKRDGVEPPKVRLTRGALVRMYARGELYPQAIAEARSALAEDSDRVDLEVLLAHIYYLTGKKVEATEICSRIVTKLPFCLEANRILTETLITGAKTEDAKIYQRRVYALDPYATFAPGNIFNSEHAPDTAVMVERLIWRPSDEQGAQPEWAKSVGFEIQAPEEKLPDWLDSMADEPENLPEEIPQEQPTDGVPPQESSTVGKTITPDLDLPDWMSSAGWQQSADGDSPTINDASDEELAPADIPDWLKSQAPEIPPDDVDGMTPEEQTRLSDLEMLLATSPNPEPGLTFDSTTDGSNNPPSSKEEPEIPPDSFQIPGIDSLPDRKPGDASTVEGAEIGFKTEAESQPENERIPDWLQEIDSGELPVTTPRKSENQEPDPTPDWLRGLTPPVEEPEVSPEKVQAFSDNLGNQPENDNEKKGENQPKVFHETPTDTFKENSEPEDMDAAMAWLESLAARQGADQETLYSAPEERPEEVPEWVQRDTAGDGEAVPADTNETLPEETPQTPTTTEVSLEHSDLEIPKTLEISIDDELPTGEESAAIEPPQISDDIPDWLRDFRPSESPDRPDKKEEPIPDWLQVEETTESSEAGEATNVLPDWLTELDKTSQERMEEGKPFDEPLMDRAPGISENPVLRESPDLEANIYDFSKTSDEGQDKTDSSISSTGESFALQDETDHAIDEEPVGEQVLPAGEISTLPVDIEETQPVLKQEEDIPIPPSLDLEKARKLNSTGNLDESLQNYEQLIEENTLLDEIITDLQAMTETHPVDPRIWKLIGEAFFKIGNLQDALDAFGVAEDLIK